MYLISPRLPQALLAISVNICLLEAQPILTLTAFWYFSPNPPQAESGNILLLL